MLVLYHITLATLFPIVIVVLLLLLSVRFLFLFHSFDVQVSIFDDLGLGLTLALLITFSILLVYLGDDAFKRLLLAVLARFAAIFGRTFRHLQRRQLAGLLANWIQSLIIFRSNIGVVHGTSLVNHRYLLLLILVRLLETAFEAIAQGRRGWMRSASLRIR